ncbi:MAG: single-stranded DNA-binding protein [Caldilineaceae bacterium SB0662_bin_9]|uniref:Single-stranded DNA-binding protein n=1 Tax=Caldilineaceae bacterium SB0662_bin_9 TaxID=2605258 RepID=A0A6B1DY75_9CHLR|nr:single-stranded DNA-binding protein [Caldilineaceae bacterium SB0662_bin_9]
MPSGDKVCSFNVAVNNVYNDRSGERRTDTTWFRVSVFGRQAEPCGRYLSRGRQVLVTGRVKSNAFMGQDGQPRASLDVRANTVQFLGGRDDQAGGDWGGGSGGGYGGGSSSGSDWNSGSGGGGWQGGNQGGGDWRSQDAGGSTGDGGASGPDIDDGQDVPF